MMALCSWLLIGLMLSPIQTASAQQPVSALPESTVLVLNLVSKTHVRPTTGVVIHTTGLVLIPADFISAADELVVLDGGTDIVRHGRPAKIVQSSGANGLAVLSVDGLERAPVVFSSSPLQEGDVLDFAAFPPAGLMANGAQPLSRKVHLESANTTNGLAVSDRVPLPNVDGPLFNSCGQLVGFNLASGTPSLEYSEGARTLLATELGVILLSMEPGPESAPCGEPVSAQAADVTELVAESESEPEPESKPETDIEPDVVTSAQEEPIAPVDFPLVQDEQPGSASLDVEEPGQVSLRQEESSKAWGWFGVTALAVVLLLLVMAGRWLRNPGRDRVTLGKPVQEPETELLVDVSDKQEPDAGFLITGGDPSGPGIDFAGIVYEDNITAVLSIAGYDDSGNSFEQVCGINRERFTIVMADDGGARPMMVNGSTGSDHDSGKPGIQISGQKANHDYQITVLNAGARTTVRIRDIPCLTHEKLHLSPGDNIILGRFQFRVRLAYLPVKP